MKGRTERTPEKMQKFLDQLAQGQSVTAGCKAAVIGRRTVYEWRESDPEFAAAWDAAIEEGTDLLEDIAKERAASGSDVLLIFMLKARRKEKFADLGVRRLTGKDDDTPIKMETTEEGRKPIQEFVAEFAPKRAIDGAAK